MKHFDNHIVFTTIFHPELLHALVENLKQFQHLEDTCVWVVGDRKTPVSVYELCKDITRNGLFTTYLDCDCQENLADRFSPFYERLPWNNETRRNIGYLCALEHGCVRLISIDDDNWPTNDDFIGGHSQTGGVYEGLIAQDESGFYNVCQHLEMVPAREVFPRGYPFRLRGSTASPTFRRASESTIIGVTAGLWLNEPDIDATTWLNGRVKAMSYVGEPTISLAQSTWTPINTQNTSVIRELIPAFLCVPMGWDVPGGKIQRYGDIWGGYFLQSVLRETPWVVSFGRPLVDHRRNPHDYVDDLRHEFWGTILTDLLLQLLKDDFKPRGKGVNYRMLELSEFILARVIPQLPSWCPDQMREFMSWTAGNIEAWIKVCRRVGSLQ